MNMDKIPTPETDAAEMCVKHTHRMLYDEDKVVESYKMRDLERRLTIARDGFKELIDAIETGSFSSGEYSRCEIKQAKETLTKTEPKP